MSSSVELGLILLVLILLLLVFFLLLFICNKIYPEKNNYKKTDKMSPFRYFDELDITA